MQETFNPTPVPDYDPEMSLAGLLREKWAANPAKVQWERKASLGSHWVPVTIDQFVAEVREAARGLVASGVEPGDRVGIMSRTRYEWTLLDFASWWVGAIPVPIYETSSADQMEWIIGDAGVSLLVTENRSHAEVARGFGPRTPLLREVLVIDDGAIPELAARGHAVDDEVVERRSRATKGSDIATIIYTSGTTGRPKGVVLWHRNFVFLARSGRIGFADVVNKPYSRTLLFMPLAHVFARFVEVLAVSTHTVLAHSPDVRNLIADLQSFQPTYLLAVPRIFEKVYNSADAKAGRGARLRLFRWAAKTAIAYSRALEQPGGPPPALKAQHRLADRLVLSRITNLLGGRLEYAVSGGAPLGERLGHFYRGAGVNILEGYGLTETTAPLSCNLSNRSKIGTVGVAFPQTAIRIDDDGQIHARGEHVFHGYWNNPEATAAALDAEGWFATGDLGSLDDEGFLRITGRAKEIIVTAGGKNVAPALLEDRLRGHPIISQVLVVGDGKPFIGALITLDPEMLPGWLANHGLPPLTVEQAARDERVLAAIDRAITRANEAVSRAESIRKFTVITEEFTESNGLLTPSLKVRRQPAIERFSREIAELYGDA